MTDSTPTDDLLARYLAGEASESDRAAVDAWASSGPAARSELDRLRAAWKQAPGGVWDVDAAWKRTSARMDKGAPVVPLAARRSWSSGVLMRAAAVLVFAAGIAAIWRPWETSPVAQAITFATELGEQRDIDLPDGTNVTLGPATELRVVAGFGGKERRVELIGEAWFNVRHDADRPFEVLAGTTITRDIGTAFTVRALRADTIVRVVLIEGFASLRHADLGIADGVTLRANDVGIMRASARVPTVVREPSVEPLVSWRSGVLDFEDRTLRDVAIELARWYGLAFRFGDARVAARTFTGQVPTNDLDATMEVLRTALQVRIERVADTLIVR